VFGHAAAEKELADIRASVRSHHNQIASALFSLLHDDLRRIVAVLFRHNGFDHAHGR
jgi:hypothetical protein